MKIRMIRIQFKIEYSFSIFTLKIFNLFEHRLNNQEATCQNMCLLVVGGGTPYQNLRYKTLEYMYFFCVRKDV